MIFLWTSGGCGTEIDVGAQPLPTGDPGRPDFTKNSSACPLVAPYSAATPAKNIFVCTLFVPRHNT